MVLAYVWNRRPPAAPLPALHPPHDGHLGVKAEGKSRRKVRMLGARTPFTAPRTHDFSPPPASVRFTLLGEHPSLPPPALPPPPRPPSSYPLRL
jgi:hypothetical protein